MCVLHQWLCVYTSHNSQCSMQKEREQREMEVEEEGRECVYFAPVIVCIYLTQQAMQHTKGEGKGKERKVECILHLVWDLPRVVIQERSGRLKEVVGLPAILVATVSTWREEGEGRSS